MPVVEFKADFPGQLMNPRLVRLKTTDTIADATAPGYLNPLVKSQGLSLLPTDFVFVSGSDSNDIFRPIFGVGGVITLFPLGA